MAGILFGVPLGVAAPSSPLMRLIINKDNFPKMAPKVSMQFSLGSAVVSALVYAVTVERGQDNRFALAGFLPYVSPPRGMLMTLSALVASHMWFPGIMAFIYEPPGKQFREYAKISVKCLVAYFPQHGAYAASVGLGIGFLLWPLMIYKDSKEAKRRTGLLPPIVVLDILEPKSESGEKS
jgi:hypothetical protein